MERSIENMVGIIVDFGFGALLISLSVACLVVCAWIISHWNA